MVDLYGLSEQLYQAKVFIVLLAFLNIPIDMFSIYGFMAIHWFLATFITIFVLIFNIMFFLIAFSEWKKTFKVIPK
jgi:hypothetical protein